MQESDVVVIGVAVVAAVNDFLTDSSRDFIEIDSLLCFSSQVHTHSRYADTGYKQKKFKNY